MENAGIQENAEPKAVEPKESAAQPSQPEFKHLNVPVRLLHGAGKSRYRVYDASAQCKEVEAETAVEALKISGVLAPTRIEREVYGSEVLVELQKLMNKPVAA